MRVIHVAVCIALFAFAPGARADEAAKDQEIARLKAEIERLTKRVQELEKALAARAGGPGATNQPPPPIEGNPGEIDSREQMRYLLGLYRRYTPPAGLPKHPALDGKRFVLYLVAVDQVERKNEGALKMLLSPADKARTFAGVPAYAQVTTEALARQSFPELTSYAGRRNSVAELQIRPDSPPATTALIADLSFPDGALVGFLDGKVKYMNRRALGLGPNDPVVAGPASKSPLLQTLSNE